MISALRHVSRLPLLLLVVFILATASAPLGADAHGYKRHKKGGGGGPSCNAIDRKCDFLTPENLTWQKQVAIFTLTSDGDSVQCNPQNQDGLSSCEFINEMDELRMTVSCPGGDDNFAVFQIATGQLVDVQPDGSATFVPWVPGITQSAIDGTAFATVGGAYGPNPDEELYWSMEVWCQPEFYPDEASGAKVAAGKVRRTAVAGVGSATPAARVSKIRSTKVAEGSG
jgi:hypothetical protein